MFHRIPLVVMSDHEGNDGAVSKVDTDLLTKFLLIKRSLVEGIRYEHLLAGIVGGTLSTLVLHPFDLIKVRFAGASG